LKRKERRKGVRRTGQIGIHRNHRKWKGREGKGIRRRVRVRVTVSGEWKEGMG